MYENRAVMNETEAIRNEVDAIVIYPWRRYLARMFDVFLYSTVWLVFLTFAFNVNLATRGSFGNLFDGFVALVLMVFIEPVWLHLFGTTPGKAIFGLHIMAPTGRLISYGEAMERTWGVLGVGMGYNLPVYNLVCLWRSYKRCSERTMQPWDEIGIYTIQDRKWFRSVIYIGVNLVLIGLLWTAIAAKDLPPNRGELSVAEFAENHNYFADYYALGLSDQALDANGQWSEIRDRGTERISIVDNEPLEYVFTVEEGELTGVSFLVERKNSHDWISLPKKQMILAALSFAGAQEEMGLHAKARREMVEFIRDSDFEDFVFEKAGVSFVCKVEYSGFIDTHAGFLIPEENSETSYYRLKFTMQNSQ